MYLPPCNLPQLLHSLGPFAFVLLWGVALLLEVLWELVNLTIVLKASFVREFVFLVLFEVVDLP